MPRLLQSILHPGSADQWLDDLRGDARIVRLSSEHPTLLVRLEQMPGGPVVSRHELVFGLFRTTWHCRCELDESNRRIRSAVASQFFSSFEQVLCWTEAEGGLSIQSEIRWEGARSSLEDLIFRSALRFPGSSAMGTTESTTKRMAVGDQAAA
jgi:hypothetical protein